MGRLCFYLFAIFVLVFPALSQKQEPPITEKVKVVNVEVPVRVFHKGEPVLDLGREDFSLWENGKQQEVSGCFLKERTIRVEDYTMAATREERRIFPSRYFVLIFRISDYGQPIQDAVAYLFDKLLAERDEVLAFVNDRQLYFRDMRQKATVRGVLERTLKDQARIAHIRMLEVIKEIELMATEYLRVWEDHPQSIFAIQDYLKVWTQVWNNYKRRFLIPEMSSFFNFARHLEKINKEKWVINFYQVEMFPRLRKHGSLRRKIRAAADHWMNNTPEWGRIIHSMLDNLEKDMNIAAEFPIEDVSKLFYKVKATFHSVFIPTTMESLSADMEYKRVATDIENSLREITKKTGGRLVASADLTDALSTIAGETTSYYVLTYAPTNSGKAGRLKIKVKNRKYDVVYDNNMRADYINEYFERQSAGVPVITISKLEFKKNKLTTTIEGFLFKEKATARVRVRIRIVDDRERVLFNQSKVLSPQQKKITVSVPFSWLKKGDYSITLNAVDLNTGKSTSKYIRPRVNGSS